MSLIGYLIMLAVENTYRIGIVVSLKQSLQAFIQLQVSYVASD